VFNTINYIHNKTNQQEEYGTETFFSPNSSIDVNNLLT